MQSPLSETGCHSTDILARYFWAMLEESPYKLSSTTVAGIAIAYLVFVALLVILFAP